MKTESQKPTYYNKGQQPDPTPGNYYVSCHDDAGTYWTMLGPFTQHIDALNAVQPAMDFVSEKQPRAWWYSWGTVKMADSYTKPGNANKFLPDLIPA